MTLKNDVIFEKMDSKSLQLRHQLKTSFFDEIFVNINLYAKCDFLFRS